MCDLVSKVLTKVSCCTAHVRKRLMNTKNKHELEEVVCVCVCVCVCVRACAFGHESVFVHEVTFACAVPCGFLSSCMSRLCTHSCETCARARVCASNSPPLAKGFHG